MKKPENSVSLFDPGSVGQFPTSLKQLWRPYNSLNRSLSFFSAAMVVIEMIIWRLLKYSAPFDVSVIDFLFREMDLGNWKKSRQNFGSGKKIWL